jgi:glutamine synthetase
MLLTMGKCGVPIEKHHHEVASGGQCELGLRFAPLVHAADYVMTYKYIVKNVAKRHGKTATFMPKPMFGDNGTGMHTHMSIWKDGQPLFAG